MALVRDALQDLTSGIRWRALMAASLLTLVAIGVLTATDAPPTTVSLVLGGAAAVITLCLVGDALVTDAARGMATPKDVPAIVESELTPPEEPVIRPAVADLVIEAEAEALVAEALADAKQARAELARRAAELAGVHSLEGQPEPVSVAGSVDVKFVLAANIRRLRKRRHWSQEMLAHFGGLHPTEISRLERGLTAPRLRAVMQVASALDVSVEELIAPHAFVEEDAKPVPPDER
jgi:DNA-binding XRE family transcriptional regulator